MCLGTHDISILSIDDGVIETKSTGGDTSLGGADLDNALVDYLASEFNKKYKVDVNKNQKALRRLKTAAEQAKKTLSSSTVANIELDSLHEGNDFSVSITRAKFESLCMSFFKKALDPLDTVLKDAKMSKGDIDEIVLVGGTTRIPKIQEMLSAYFNGKELNKSVNPDEAVAVGAAIQAAILSGNTDEKLDSLLLLDIVPLSLGVETAGSIMTVLIPRGTTVPAKKTQVFSTGADNQPGCTICVFEGERKVTSECNLLGKFDLHGIPPMPRGQPQIEITYDVDVNGILNVNACEKSSGKSEKITIKNESNRLSQEEIDRMIKEAEKFKDDDEKFQNKITAKNNIENYVYNIRSSVLSNDKMKASIGADLSIVENTVNDTIGWIDANKNATQEEYERKQKEVEDLLKPLLEKAYKENGPPQDMPTPPDVTPQ
jgi:L1 cell adhesion molecule like protein